ncbi:MULTISPECIES: stage II sporulation protein M [unclassified Agrococcus]|uniref:stage II sporulation protein M n=1 Tax=unclassified Agrococcus TaxID=2615065 RepID=UPI00360DDB40
MRRARASETSRSASRRIVGLSIVLGALALVPAALVAAAAAGGLALDNAVGVAAGDLDATHLADATTFGEILARNLSAAALLVAGAPLAGIPTLGGGAVVGFGVGAGMRAVLGAIEPGELAARVLAYAPLELLGIVLAAAAGLAPLAAVVLDRLGLLHRRSWRDAVVRGLVLAARLAAVALLCLVVAAAVEAILIASAPH